MTKGRIIRILISVFVIAAAFAGCGDESAEVKETVLKMPEEDFVVTNIAYSQEKGLQISGFTKSESHKITASVWNYGKDEKWKKGFEKVFSCEDGKAIEA